MDIEKNIIMSIKPIKIPTAYTNNVISRNFVKQMASDGFLPVILLEAFVEGGRTYQAYNRGGFDEARERITEEFSGAIFWLGGVTGLNWVFEKLGQKLLHLPKTKVDIAGDDVRNPLGNYLEFEKHTNNNAKILETTMAKFKFVKVISSVLLANAFIGFILPKINQSITRFYHRDKDTKPITTPYISNPTMDTFIKKQNDKKNNKENNQKDISFGLNLLSIANKFENDRNYKLLSVDTGTASGRAISARNNDERCEILFRDLASIYFYMFNMPNINTWLNKIEQNGVSTRLDPVSAEFTSTYMKNYLESKGTSKVSVNEFEKDMFGQDKAIPDSIKAKFKGSKIKIINLEEFTNEMSNIVDNSELGRIKEVADEMSKLQPQIKGTSILTEGQVKAILDGGYLNSPQFLKEFYKNKFGKKFMNKYSYVAQSELDDYKKDLINYVKSIIETAKKKSNSEITANLLNKMSNKNLKLNALNWGIGFVTSALFLSTIIPKVQYLITRLRTGSNEFPGTEEYRNKK